MDYNLIFTLTLAATVLFAVLRGYLRGYKKSLYYFIVTLAFYAIFFLTLNTVTQLIYTAEVPALAGVAEFTGPTLEVTIDNLLDDSLGNDFAFITDNPESAAFIESLALFAVKLVWALLYFTVVSVFYWLITRFIGLFFVRVPRDKTTRKKERKRGMGAVVGALHGLVAVSMLLILTGGIINLNQSLLVIADVLVREDTTAQNSDLMLLNDTDPVVLEGLDELRGVVDGFVNNPIVNAFDQIAVGGVPYYLVLFDQIFSLDYEDVNIPLRSELAIMADIATLFNEDALDPALLDPSAISTAFNRLADSRLVEAFMPVAVRALVNEFGDENLDLSRLEGLDWAEEIRSLGQIISLTVAVMQQANAFNEETPLSMVALNEADVVALFDALGASDVLAISLEAGFEFFLRDAQEPLSLILVWPENLDFAAEMSAVGQIVVALIDAGVTFDNEDEETFDFITPLLGFDFTLLLESQLISEALIRIVDGTAQIEALDMLEVPLNTVWRDTVVDGQITQKGELRLMFEAMTAIFNAIENFDFENPSLELIAQFDETLIETVFESRVLLATVSVLITELDLAGTPLILPDTVLDAEGYLLKDEMVILANGLSLVLNAMSESEAGFDVNAVLSLSEAALDSLLDSQIIAATIGRLMIDFVGQDILRVPPSVLDTVLVNGQGVSVVSQDEVKDVFAALNVLGLSNFTSLEFNANFFANLTDPQTGLLDEDKLDTFFASEIIYATLSFVLLDSLDGSGLTIPVEDPSGDPLRFTEDGLDYITRDELSAFFQAIATTGLLNFGEVDGIDFSVILDNLSVVLDSAIFHATLSSQLSLAGGGFIQVPENTVNGDPMVVVVGPVGQQTTYVDADELIALFDALALLGFTDLEEANTGFNVALLIGIENQDNRDTFFASSIMYATFSEVLLGLNDGLLTIPDTNLTTSAPVRVTLFGTDYLDLDEIDAFLNALEALGITSFDNLNLSPQQVFGSDLDIVLVSAIMQASLSEFILENATDELAPSATGIIVPTALRQNITVLGLPQQQIEADELKALFNGLDLLGLSSYDGALGGPSFSSLTQAQLDSVFESGSLHYTAHHILADAAALSVPTLALESTPYGNIISRAELVRLIEASNTLGNPNFATASLTFAQLNNLSPQDRDTILASQVMRNVLTPDIEDIVSSTPGVDLLPSDYENNDTSTFLTQAGIERILDELS